MCQRLARSRWHNETRRAEAGLTRGGRDIRRSQEEGRPPGTGALAELFLPVGLKGPGAGNVVEPEGRGGWGDPWHPLRSPARGWRLLGAGRNGKINSSLGLPLPPTSSHCSPCLLLPNWTRAPISAGRSPASKSKSSCEVGQPQRSTRAHSMAGQRAGPVAGNFFFLIN